MDWLESLLLPANEEGLMAVDWRRQGFVYQPKTLLQRLLYHLLQNADKTKVCGNIECKHPFFIGKRANERYCSDPCFENAQRLASADWWKERGKAWRASRRRAAKKERS
jgi:hypothetical protein